MTAVARSDSPRKKRRHLAPATPERASYAPLAVLAVLLVMGTALATVAVQTVLVEAKVEADQLEREIRIEQARQAELSLEVAALESPGRILEEARSRLGMVPPIDRPYLAPVVPGDPENPIDGPGDDPFGQASGGEDQ